MFARGELLPAKGLLEDGIREGGLALLLEAQPVDLSLVRREIIDHGLQRHELTHGLGVKRSGQKCDVERLGRIELGLRESLVCRDACQLRLGPEECGDLIAQRRLQPRRDSGLQSGRVCAVVSNTTFPLAMNVSTFAKPSDSKISRRRSILTVCPPTLMARGKRYILA